MTGEQAWDKIFETLRGHYDIERKAAGYEGERQSVIDSRRYADTSMYMTIRGDCPEHNEEMHYDCFATIKVRLSDHEPGQCEPDFNLYYDTEDEYGEVYDNAAVVESVIAAAKQMPEFDADLDEARREDEELYACILD